MKPVLCFDIESTGTDPATDRIISIAMQSDEDVRWDWLIDPDMPIPEEATAVHGISNKDVAGMGTFGVYSDEIHQIISQYDLVGFNLSNFDIPILWEEFYRVGITWDLSDTKIFDAGTLFKRREERSLAAALRFYCGKSHEDAHNAMSDVVATWDVWNAQLERYSLKDADRDKLADESSYDEVRVDLAGKIVIGKDGRPAYNIGKAKGTAVVDDPGFGYWMLNKDFSANTKMHLEAILHPPVVEEEAEAVSSDGEPF